MVLTVGSGIAVVFVSTPLIIDHVGRSGYGAWTLCMAFVVYLGIAEAGIGPAAQRHVALASGRADRVAAARVLWTSLAAYLALGLALLAVTEALAPWLAEVFGFTGALRDETEALIRIVGIALPASLLVTALGNVLQGLGRYDGVAASTIAGSLVFLAALVALVLADASLAELAWAILAQQALMLAVRAVLLRDVIAAGPPRLIGRAQARDMAGYSARLQVSVLSLLVNGQSDKAVAGLVGTPAGVAAVGIGAQVAEGGRLLAAAPLTPMITRLAAAEGAGDHDALHGDVRRLDRVWRIAVLGGTAIGAASAYPLVRAWLGPGFGEAAAFAGMLVVAYGTNLMLGVRTGYLRAVGRIGLEARLGLLLIALNVALTIPLAIALGVAGVVAGTLGAYLVATAWAFARFPHAAPEADVPRSPLTARVAVLALLAAAAAGGAGFAAAEALPRFVGLPVVAGAILVALGGYLAAALGIAPTPRALRALIGATGGEAGAAQGAPAVGGDQGGGPGSVAPAAGEDPDPPEPAGASQDAPAAASRRSSTTQSP